MHIPLIYRLILFLDNRVASDGDVNIYELKKNFKCIKWNLIQDDIFSICQLSDGNIIVPAQDRTINVYSLFVNSSQFFLLLNKLMIVL